MIMIHEPERKLTPAERFGEQLGTILNHAGLALMISVGHRTGLFDVMARRDACTSPALAQEAGLSERYVREWLGAMTTGGIVTFEPDTQTYCLPPEHAAWLTRAASPNNLAASMQWIALLGSVETQVVDAFRHGQGVPYSAYDRFHEIMSEESDQTVVAALEPHILPLVPGLIERLEQGMDVMDVGCGMGRAMATLAARFPRSRFVGYDASAEAIGRGQAEAEAQGLTNLRLAVADVATLSDTNSFDLITAFDAIHDQARPDAVLEGIARALRPEGILLMQDISGTGHVDRDCGHPFGPFLYAISCMHCMSVSLAAGGPGLGAMWGKEKALTLLAEAGFGAVRVEMLPHDPMNYFYLAKR
jgi:ubiquinone/menaquinone biosynthesis C-methylase UbiE